ncbi:MAG: hypothetical protein ACJ796_20785 [Gemmatimonadaceae bacterium]
MFNEAAAVMIESASSFSEGVRVRRLVGARLAQLCTQLVEGCKQSRGAANSTARHANGSPIDANCLSIERLAFGARRLARERRRV